MRSQRHTITLATQQPIEIVDITAAVTDFVATTGVQNGWLQVMSRHTTAAVAINERCEALMKDIQNFLTKLVPPTDDYHHNAIAVDGRPNAHSHLLSLLLPSQVSLMIVEGTLQLGSWQSLFAIELDGPRSERHFAITVMGE